MIGVRRWSPKRDISHVVDSGDQRSAQEIFITLKVMLQLVTRFTKLLAIIR